jgi:hypothetical protein
VHLIHVAEGTGKRLAGAHFQAGVSAFRPAFHAARRTPLETRKAFGYSDSIDTPPAKEQQMNIIRNMEAAFLFSLSVAGVASVAIDAVPPAQAHVPAQAANSIATPSSMAVVKVSARRMTALEKQQSLAVERARQGA